MTAVFQNLVNVLQAIHCSLADIAPVNKEWTDDASAFLNSLNTEVFNMVVRQAQSPGSYEVSLNMFNDYGGIDISDMLVDSGWAR